MCTTLIGIEGAICTDSARNKLFSESLLVLECILAHHWVLNVQYLFLKLS